MNEKTGDQITGRYELLDAIEKIIRAADPALRKELAEIFEAYSYDFPEEFEWAVGAQSPMLLWMLMNAIWDASGDPSSEPQPRRPASILQLVRPKPKEE
jgi:hypothetical protein